MEGAAGLEGVMLMRRTMPLQAEGDEEEERERGGGYPIPLGAGRRRNQRQQRSGEERRSQLEAAPIAGWRGSALEVRCAQKTPGAARR
jgi:hypothetical protein